MSSSTTRLNINILNDPRLALICLAAKLCAYTNTNANMSRAPKKWLDRHGQKAYHLCLSNFIKPHGSVWRSLPNNRRRRLLSQNYPWAMRLNNESDTEDVKDLFEEWQYDIMLIMPELLFMKQETAVNNATNNNNHDNNNNNNGNNGNSNNNSSHYNNNNNNNSSSSYNSSSSNNSNSNSNSNNSSRNNNNNNSGNNSNKRKRVEQDQEDANANKKAKLGNTSYKKTDKGSSSSSKKCDDNNNNNNNMNNNNNATTNAAKPQAQPAEYSRKAQGLAWRSRIAPIYHKN